jgi:hypothetical protein
LEGGRWISYADDLAGRSGPVRRLEGPLCDERGRSYIEIEDDRPSMTVGGKYLEVVETKDAQARDSPRGSDIDEGGTQGDRAE